MTEPSRPKTFAALEAKFRQLVLMAGLGFLGLVAGAFVTASLLERVAGRLDPVEGGLAERLALIAIGNLWALAVLPGLGWLTLRLLDLRPLTFALVSSGTAFAFRLALDLIINGVDVMIADPELMAQRLGSLVAAVVLTTWAGRRARAAVSGIDAEAKVKAQATQAQYAEFAEQARALADRREASPISVAPAAADVDPTAASHGIPAQSPPPETAPHGAPAQSPSAEAAPPQAAPAEPPAPNPAIADAIAEALAAAAEPAPASHPEAPAAEPTDPKP